MQEAVSEAVAQLRKGASEVTLEGCSIDQENAKVLAEAIQQSTTLTCLFLNGNDIEDDACDALTHGFAHNTSLTNLNLYGNGVSIQAARRIADVLRHNSTLTSLVLDRNNINAEAATSLAEALKENDSLTSLDLEDNDIGSVGASSLAGALTHNHLLLTLVLDSNSITAEGVTALAEALKHNTSLTTLDLGANTTSDAGAIALADALKQNRSLKTLVLDRNKIGIPGGTALAEALKQNTSLANLNIRGNAIGVPGAIAFSEALKQNTSLTNLFLWSNSIGDTGASALADALKVNRTLTNLFLSWNQITDVGAKKLSSALKRNNVLTNLDLAFNEVRAEYYSRINAYLERNKQHTLSIEDDSSGSSGSGTSSEAHSHLNAFSDSDIQLLEGWKSRQVGNPLASLTRPEELCQQIAEKRTVFERMQDQIRDSQVGDVALRDAVRAELIQLLREALSINLEQCIAQANQKLNNELRARVSRRLHELHAEGNESHDVAFEHVHDGVAAALRVISEWKQRHNNSSGWPAESDRSDETILLDSEKSPEANDPVANQPEDSQDSGHDSEPPRTELEDANTVFKQGVAIFQGDGVSGDAPWKEVQKALALIDSFYKRTVAALLLRLRTSFADFHKLLSFIAQGATPPDSSCLEEMLRQLKVERRKRDRLCLDLKDVKEDIFDAGSDAERDRLNAKIWELEAQVREIDLHKLDRKARQARARLLRAAQDHYPELLWDQDWCRRIGISDQAFLEVSYLGLWLEGTRAVDFETVRSLSSTNGKVVLAVKNAQGENLVLKKFPLAEERGSSRFCRQVAALAVINSAHVIRITGLFIDHDESISHGCILMPYYPQGDLASWILQNAHADEETCKRIAIGVLSGIHDLHKCGHVHCDIKPANIFLTSSLSPVIGDFDGVQQANRTMTHSLQVTWNYIAPEIRFGGLDKVSEKVDLYSAGVLLEELFPRPRKSMRQLIIKLKSEDPAERPSALDALQHRAFNTKPVRLRSCIICLDNLPAPHGVTCRGSHFVCKDCVTGSVEAASLPETSVKVTRDGTMQCMSPNCDHIISGADIARQVPQESFDKLIKIVREHMERDVSISQEREVQRRVQEALFMDGLNRDTERHLRHIQDRILCTCCPRCHTVFDTFNGCCALKCSNSRCKCRFCAWCLEDTGSSTQACHRHVADCPKNNSKEHDPYFPASFEIVQQAWIRVRAERLLDYWKREIQTEELQNVLRERLAPLLTPDVVGEGFIL